MTKRILITGASSGIGRETALLLAEQHFELVLIARNEERLREVEGECRARGAARADIIAVELGPSWNSAEVVEEAVGDNPTAPLVLISCAGVAEFGPYADMEWSSIEGIMATNLGVPLRMCHAILPQLLARGGGQIINVLSIAATQPFAGGAAYCVAKAGLHMFGRALSADYRAQGIRVTSILPGSTDTPLWDKLGFSPEKSDMMPTRAVAEVIRDVVLSPPDRNLDEIVVMPPKGFLDRSPS